MSVSKLTSVPPDEVAVEVFHVFIIQVHPAFEGRGITVSKLTLKLLYNSLHRLLSVFPRDASCLTPTRIDAGTLRGDLVAY